MGWQLPVESVRVRYFFDGDSIVDTQIDLLSQFKPVRDVVLMDASNAIGASDTVGWGLSTDGRNHHMLTLTRTTPSKLASLSIVEVKMIKKDTWLFSSISVRPHRP